MNSIGPITLTATTSNESVNLPNWPVEIDKVVFINESPFTLTVNAQDGKVGNKKIAAFTQDVIQVGVQFFGQFLVSASADISFSGTAPVSVLYVEVYGPAEGLPGQYPAALTRITNIGNTIPVSTSANSIQNSGETPPQTIISFHPTGFSFNTWTADDEGNLRITPNSNGSQQDAFRVVAGAGAGVYAQIQFDNDRLETDGQGGLATNTAFYTKAGHSEFGVAGARLNATAGQRVGIVVNFKTVLQSVPGSISIVSTDISVNVTGASVQLDTIDQYGFRLTWVATSSAVTELMIHYQT